MALPVKEKGRGILITGGDGYIGQHLQRLLPESQVLDRTHGDELKNFNPASVQWKDLQHVIHLADLRLQDINADNLKANVQTHANFLNKISDLPNLKKIIFSSSCSVYGASENEITDSSEPQPTSYYAESKLAVESILQSTKIPHLILRFGTAYGWSPRLRHDLLINQLTKAAVAGESVDIYSADAWRPYVHCKDFAHVLAASVNEEAGGPLNIVSENLTKRQLLNLPAFAGSKIKTREVPDKDPRNYKVKIVVERLPHRTSMMDGVAELFHRFSHA